MKKVFLAFFVSFVCISVIGPYVSNADARTKKMLQERTQLRPVGWPGSAGKVWFAPGPYWVDEFEGGVQSGTLDEVISLRVYNGQGSSVRFSRGLIRFERADGGVKEGTLASDIKLPVVNTGGRNRQTISLAAGTIVEFGYDGGVMRGTLNEDSFFFPEGINTSSKKYPKDATLYFNGAGQVVRSVLPTGTTVPPGEPTPVDGLYKCNCIIPSQSLQFECEFTARNGLFEGVKELDETCHLDYKGNYAKNGAITNGSLTGWADINHWRDEEEWGKSAAQIDAECGFDRNWRNRNANLGPTVKCQEYRDYGPKRERLHCLRWTIRGPISGTLRTFSMTATSIDGQVTKYINCTATPFVPNINTSVVLLLDLSGSMAGKKLADAKAAAKKVIKTMPPDFEVGIMTYEGACNQNFPFMTFTQDKQRLENAIDSLTTGGGTPLSTALTQAAQAIIKLGNGKQGKIILLCDGQDDCHGDLVGEASLIKKGLDVKMPKKGGETSSAQTRFWAHLNLEYWKVALGTSLAWAADPDGFTRFDFGSLQAPPERQSIPIRIYTVGFQVNKSQQKVLDDVATAGGGTSASAENMEELTKAFSDAIIDEPAPKPTPPPIAKPANRDEWQSTGQKSSPPPMPQRPPSDGGWEPIGGKSSSAAKEDSGNLGVERATPKGNKMPDGF